jgi:phosphoglycerol transferase
MKRNSKDKFEQEYLFIAVPLTIVLILLAVFYVLSLIRSPTVINIDFTKSEWPEVIESASGLSTAENWGTWSFSNIVEFEFSEPLPEKFYININAIGFGPNVGKSVEVKVGDEINNFVLSGAPEEIKLDAISNPGELKQIIITGPDPVSPKKVGIGEDDRYLGIGFVNIKIIPIY